MGKYSEKQLREIFDSGEGVCFYCGKKLVWSNYGKLGTRGAWEVAHVHAKSRGGADTLTNLAPSCIECNRKVQDRVSIYDNIRKYFKPSLWPVILIGGIITLIAIINAIIKRILNRFSTKF
jgi:5-methylcytosine-specific restriction endonuclease McrA